jgi:hypothetical protein
MKVAVIRLGRTGEWRGSDCRRRLYELPDECRAVQPIDRYFQAYGEHEDGPRTFHGNLLDNGEVLAAGGHNSNFIPAYYFQRRTV